MCENDQNITSSLIPIIIALIAGLIALWQVKNNYYSKASLKWIDEVRNLLSNYLTEIFNIQVHFQNWQDEKKQSPPTKKTDQLYQDYLISHTKCNILNKKLQLYFDHERKENFQILNILNNLDDAIDEENIADNKYNLREASKELIKLTNKILFTQWKKSKNIFHK